MASLGHKRMNPGLTMADINDMVMHVGMLANLQKTARLFGYYKGLRRLLVVVDAESKDGDTQHETLLCQLDVIVPELASDSDGEPSEWRLLVVMTTDDPDALQLQDYEVLFVTFGARFKEMKVSIIGMQENASILDTALDWLQRPL